MIFKEFYKSLHEASSVAPSSTATGQHQGYFSANKLKKEAKEKIPGGRADGISDDNFDPEQLASGEKEEMEHTHDRVAAREIAKDHLINDPNYYKKYKKVFEAMDPVTSRKYELAKAKNLTYKGWGEWSDISGKSYHWDDHSLAFTEVGHSKTDDAATHFRSKDGHEVRKQGKNILVHKKDGDTSKEEVNQELKKKYGDHKFKTSNITLTDKDGRKFNAVMVRHDWG